MTKIKLLYAVLTTSTMISGCTLAEFNSINRSFNPTSGDARLIDAKQRAIIAVQPKKSRTRNVIVCAEPSPDAIQATAAALEGSGAFSRPGIGEASLQAAAGFSDSVASIGLRTQSIQLLRDSYYRNCEGFANGALDDVGFNIMHQRFQNHTVALLAIEQLTGAAVAPAAAVAASGSATAQAPDINVTAVAGDQGSAQLDAESAAEQATQPAEAAEGTTGSEPATPTGDTTQTSSDTTSTSGRAGGSVTTTVTSSVNTARPVPQPVPEHVSYAVAAITQDALNQDYSLQLCLEFAREVFTKESAVEVALKPNRHKPGKNVGESVQALEGPRMALDYCNKRLHQDTEQQRAVKRLIEAKASMMQAVANGIQRRGRTHLSDKHALEIIEAINLTLPSDPRTAFAYRTPPLTGAGLAAQSKDPCPEGFALDRSRQTCVAK